MAKAKKLPSGSWRCQVYSHTEEIQQPDGSIKSKRVYKSFTIDDTTAKGRRKFRTLVAEWAAKKEAAQTTEITFGEALDKYIASKENILSPRTIMDYRATQRNYVQQLMAIKIHDLSQQQIQQAINMESLHLSPKTIRNIHGLISAVIKVYRPDFALNTALPRKERTEYTYHRCRGKKAVKRRTGH